MDGPRELARKVAALGPGDKADLHLWHDRFGENCHVKLGSLPDEQGGQGRDRRRLAEKTALTSFGLQLAPASSVPGAGKEGVVVAEIDPDGVAAQKGLRVGDVILEAGGKPVGQPSDDRQVSLATPRRKAARPSCCASRIGDNTHYVALAITPAT